MYIGQKLGIYPFSTQLIHASTSEIEVVYYALRKRDMIESIFSSLITSKDRCLRHVYEVKLPKNMCPFGCKVSSCPYGWDADKCPHNLDKMDLSELSSYVIKCFYMTDDNSEKEERLSKKMAPETLKSFMDWKRPGKRHGRDRQNNN